MTAAQRAERVRRLRAEVAATKRHLAYLEWLIRVS